jgi:hypothetical protein
LSTRFECVDRDTGEVWFKGVSVTTSAPCRRCGKPTRRDRSEGFCCVDDDRGIGWCGHASQLGDVPFFSTTTGERTTPPPHIHRPRAEIDGDVQRHIEATNRECQSYMDDTRFIAAEESIGLAWHVLDAIGIGWSQQHSAYTFPMYDADRRVIGIRVRYDNGEKKAVRGSRNGLFLVSQPELVTVSSDVILIPEGPTDTAACLSLGFNVIGRPFNVGGMDDLARILLDYPKHRVVVVGDNDDAGTRGVEAACSRIGKSREVRFVYPPTRFKDIRQWHINGAVHADVVRLINNTTAWRPT